MAFRNLISEARQAGPGTATVIIGRSFGMRPISRMVPKPGRAGLIPIFLRSIIGIRVTDAVGQMQEGIRINNLNRGIVDSSRGASVNETRKFTHAVSHEELAGSVAGKGYGEDLNTNILKPNWLRSRSPGFSTKDQLFQGYLALSLASGVS